MGERASRTLRRVALGSVWAAAAYYFLFGGEYSLFELRELQSQRRAVAARVDSLEKRAGSLDQRADSLASEPFAVERTARERYGFLRDGERLYRFVEAGEEGGTEVDRPGTRR